MAVYNAKSSKASLSITGELIHLQLVPVNGAITFEHCSINETNIIISEVAISEKIVSGILFVHK
jgi:hypothetical protein